MCECAQEAGGGEDAGSSGPHKPQRRQHVLFTLGHSRLLFTKVNGSCAQPMSDALPHPPTAVAEAVAKYRPRRLGPSTQDGTHARVATGAATSRVPPLTLLCLDAVTKNFQLYPSMDGMDPKFTAAITATLPLDMDVLVSGPHVHDEHYWRRVCTEGKKWQNCQIAQHGMSWKQLFFETYVGEALEGFGNYGDLPKGHEEDFLRPPIDSKHPKWKVMYPEVPAKLPPAGILPARERFCSRGIDCDGVRVMASPNSGWPALERLKSTTQPIVQSYADSYAWATVSGADIAAAKAASAAADATVVSTLTGTKFGGAGAPSTSHGPRRGAAASEFNLAHMIGAWGAHCHCCYAGVLSIPTCVMPCFVHALYLSICARFGGWF